MVSADFSEIPRKNRGGMLQFLIVLIRNRDDGIPLTLSLSLAEQLKITSGNLDYSGEVAANAYM